MEKSTGIQQPGQRKKLLLALLWIFIGLLLVFLLGSRFLPAINPFTSGNGDLPAGQLLASTATTGSTSTIAAPATSRPTASPTSTTTATLTRTPTLTSTPPTTVLVKAKYISLRTGPGLTFAVVQQVEEADQLQLLGVSSDNSWLYLRTVEGNEGWLEVTRVDLTGVDLNKGFPVKTPSPAPPGTHFSTISKLDHRAELLLLGKSMDTTWLYVKTTDGQEGWVVTSVIDLGNVNLIHDDYPKKTSPPTETSTPVILTDVEGRWIDVDLSEQTVRAYEGTTLLKTFLVSTGVDEYPTETGQYKIYAKFPKILMAGFDYYLPDVPFSMFYEGDFSLHGTYWHHNFGHPMSHGCINMDTLDAEWLYNWSDIGTLVNIHR